MTWYRFLLPLLLAALLAACAEITNAPVINKAPHRKIPAETTVGPGDSIYTISWRYGLDFIDVAKWNGLAKPYDVQEGSRLRLRKDSAAPSTAAATVRTLPDEEETVVSEIQAVGAVQPAPTAAPEGSLPKAPPASWHWPARGDLIARYSREKGVNGIRIAAAPGTPIIATAAGEVVYVGEGLRGYGRLVILKHSDTYLSAYAHNRRILVAEGDRIGAGQQIAEMGDSGADRTMLHFEIRVNGKPQDPLKYLKT